MKFRLHLLLAQLLFICNSLVAAPSYSPQDQPFGYIAPMERSAKKILDSSLKLFRPSFNPYDFEGDIVEYVAQNVDGKLSLVTDVTVNPGTNQPVGGAAQWSLSYNFSLKDATWWNANRKIIFLNTSAQQRPFRWDHLSVDQKALLHSIEHVNFIRGDRSQEIKQGGTFRDRASILGTIIHSNPTFVGGSNELYLDASYLAFRSENATRAPQLIVGANDGMVHIFNANTGQENYAYVPGMLLKDLHLLTTDHSAHPYFVNGKIAARDVLMGSQWATVAVGGLGSGAKGLWALNVSTPALINEMSAAPGNKKILWEIDGTANPDVGYIYEQPSIVRLKDSATTSKFYAIVGNGFLSTNGLAKLLIIDLESGLISHTITASPNGDGTDPNGLAMPALIDTNNDGIVDLGYAGTINGELIKFSFGEGAANWKKEATLFETPGQVSNPIIQTPLVAKHPQMSGYLIYFPTGKLFSPSDITDLSDQWLYGIWDSDTSADPVLDSQLLEQTLSSPLATVFSGEAFTVSDAQVVWGTDGHKGWKVRLTGGSRILVGLSLRSKRIRFTVTNPSEKKNWDGELNFLNGNRPKETIYDLNLDGVFDEHDKATTGETIVMLESQNGICSEGILLLNNPSEIVLKNCLDLGPAVIPPPPVVPPPAVGPPIPDPCSTGCVGGLEGGHFDVDIPIAFDFSGLKSNINAFKSASHYG